MERVFERAKEILRQNGCSLIDVDIGSIDSLDFGVEFVSFEARTALRKYLNENKISLSLEELVQKMQSPDAKALFENSILETGSNTMNQDSYKRCLMETRPKLIDEYRRIFDQVDVLAYPTMVCLPPKIDNLNATHSMKLMIRNTDLSSNAGIPSLSIPMGASSDGVPIGILLDAFLGKDKFLLRCGGLIHKIFVSNE